MGCEAFRIPANQCVCRYGSSKAIAAGQDLIDLSLGSSDLPAEAHVIEALILFTTKHPRLLAVSRHPSLRQAAAASNAKIRHHR